MSKLTRGLFSWRLAPGAWILISAVILSGCDSVRDTFGLNHSAPNEWNTAEPNPPLVIPPGLLDRPKLPLPVPGAPNPNTVSPEKRAETTVLGDTPAPLPAPSAEGEKDVIEKASEKQTVTPNIRKLVDEEAQADSNVSEKVISKIKSWKAEASKNLGFSKAKEEDAGVEKEN